MKCICTGVVLTLIISSISAQISNQESAETYGIHHQYINPTTGGGVSIFDFNHDGLDDLTLATEAGRELGFYLNQGDHFELIDPLVNNIENVKQILWVDFDNDGDSDLYVAAYEGYNRLYENTGNLNMVDITTACGFPTETHRGYGACWGDYNRDGWLDLYFSSRKIPGNPNGVNVNRLFSNNSDGTFTEVTVLAGVADSNKIPFCSAFIDYNNDKWPDIYTANDKLTGNTLLRNLKDGTFADVSAATLSNYSLNAMCVNPADINRDGWTDIYVTNTQEGNICLMNNGPIGMNNEVTFDEISETLGITFLGIGWGSHFLDADNDGDLDLYVSGSIPGTDNVSSRFYEHTGGLQFETGNHGFAGDTTASFSNAIGDLNSDGYIDIVVQNNAPDKFHVWENKTNNANNWIKIQLEGVLSNRDGTGTKIENYCGALYQSQYTTCGVGFLGQNSSFIHFGIGQRDIVDSIVVTWPTGHIDRFFSITSNQVFSVKEGQSTNGIIAVDPDIEIVTSVRVEPTLRNTDISGLLSIYPNPATAVIKILNISPERLTHSDIVIRSAEGRACIQIRHHAMTEPISVSGLTPGVYWLEIRNGKKYGVVKWVKI